MVNRTPSSSNQTIGTQSQSIFARPTVLFGGVTPTELERLPSPRPLPGTTPGLRSLNAVSESPEVRSANAAALKEKIATAKKAMEAKGTGTGTGATAISTLPPSGDAWFRQQARTRMDETAYERFLNFGMTPDERF